MKDSQLFWIGFNHVKGIGPVRLRRLRSFFGDLETAWNAAPAALAEAGLGQKLRERLIHARAALDLEKIRDDYQRRGIRVLTWEDDEYPRHLVEIDGSPPVLYLRGSILPEDHWAVAVVGTRRMTPYGRQVTQELVGAIARYGLTVVSGLARGVDSVAHREVLRRGGRTLAILGCGVDQVYPPENRRLASEIQKQGALISDYPPATAPEAMHFPARNRIIAGLSQVIVVIEAGERSGALITASFGADQGKEVFAVPGNIHAPQSRGANRLIQIGAKPMLQSSDVLAALELSTLLTNKSARKLLPANEIEAALLEVVSRQPLHIDQICSQAALNVQDVSAALTMMELKGYVRNIGNMRYVLN